MIRGGFDRQIVLLTAKETMTFTEVVNLINEITDRKVRVELVPPNEFVRLNANSDEGGKPEEFFCKLLTWHDAIARGESGMTDPLMADLLGRDPTSPREAITKFLVENRDYEWHQNYANRA